MGISVRFEVHAYQLGFYFVYSVFLARNSIENQRTLDKRVEGL